MTEALTGTAPPPWLSGPRLALREFCAGDLAELVAMHAEPRLRAQLLDDCPLDQAFVAWRFLDNIQAVYRQHEGLGIWHASSGREAVGQPRRFIGWFNLMPLAGREPGAVELGSRLLPSAWGGALALEGGELLLKHAFLSLGRERVWATCHPDNRSARRCLAALGFAEQGLDDYEGRPGALYAVLPRERWQVWLQQPRRSRLRQAAAAAPTCPQEARP